MTVRHAILLSEDGFCIVHRGRSFGPFNYQWSGDLGGIELHYAGRKFGEYCSPHEIFADMAEFQLPTRVVEAGCIALGCIIRGVLDGLSPECRNDLIAEQLAAAGLSHFSLEWSAE